MKTLSRLRKNRDKKEEKQKRSSEQSPNRDIENEKSETELIERNSPEVPLKSSIKSKGSKLGKTSSCKRRK